MKLKGLRSFCATFLLSAPLMVASHSVQARDFISRPVPQAPTANSLAMTCERALNFVKVNHGAVLTSGPNRYDFYYPDAEGCFLLRQTTQGAYVPTKDEPQCFVGYTCIDPAIDNLRDR